MGYRGKLAEQERARQLRATGMTIADIAAELGVGKGSVSVWVRDVPFIPSKRRYGPRLRPNALQTRKQEEIDWANERGRELIGSLSDRDLLLVGAALYAGEGAKTDRAVVFTNSDPLLVSVFLRWLRSSFEIDESRLRLRLYLHEGLDLGAAIAHWADLTGIPPSQMHKPYRARPDATIRRTKHVFGCAAIVYHCAKTHREIMGIVRALLTCDLHSGVAQSAEQLTVNQ